MTYDFFASKNDKINVLDFIYNETDLRVFDLYSPYGEIICEYENITEIFTKFDFEYGDKHALTFQLWSPSFEANIEFRKVELDPKYCNGYTFRFATSGWGLIQLYFGGIKNDILYPSHIGHFNEKGALKNQHVFDLAEVVEKWNWKEVQKASSKLKYYIHEKKAIRKIGSFGVLQGASNLNVNGVKLFGT